ncbi:hypothetical protein evm_014395 [Chilo suppressalis]|nr:hypothetical protein evm_014395 [Chilo suppressalis]
MTDGVFTRGAWPVHAPPFPNGKCIHHHHQPINVPTAGAQAFLMDGIGILGHVPPRGPSAAHWWVLTTADAAGTNGLTCLPKHGGARDTNLINIVSLPVSPAVPLAAAGLEIHCVEIMSDIEYYNSKPAAKSQFNIKKNIDFEDEEINKRPDQRPRKTNKRLVYESGEEGLNKQTDQQVRKVTKKLVYESDEEELPKR